MTTPSIPEQASERQGDLARIFATLRRRAGVILLCVLLVGGGALAASLLEQKEFRASASLLFRNPGFAEALFGTNGPIVTPANAAREAATNAQLVGLEVVAARTAKKLRHLSPQAVTRMVTVSANGESDVVSVTATGPHPRQARRVANVFAEQFIAFRARADRSKLLQAKRLANRQFHRLPAEDREGTRGKALSRAAERLGVLASLQTGNAELVQHATLPTAPSSPTITKNALTGASIGLLLGILLAFVLEQLNRRLRDPEEASEAFGMPVLGTIPESKAIRSGAAVGDSGALPFLEVEAFRMLQASLQYFNVDHEIRSVAIASHEAETGKSTVAWHLAQVASSSVRVVLVEADLRSPSFTRRHELSPGPGLAEVLTHQLSLDDAIRYGESFSVGGNGARNGSGGGGSPDVIVAGTVPPNPAELLGSQTMRTVLSTLESRYELVIVDTAPLAVVADSYPLVRELDGTLIVARMGVTSRDAARRAREQLDRLDASVLGIVANGVKSRRGAGYGYGYYGGSAEQAAAAASTG